jgi:hypothetical protein
MTAALLLFFAVSALLFWLILFPQYIFCELFELTDKGGTEGIQLAKRQRQFNLFFELPLFLLFRLPKSFWRKGKKIFSSSMSCCYKIPHYAGIVGGKIPTRLYLGTPSTQLTLSFPWQRPLQAPDDECGSVSNFIYCNDESCPSLAIELHAPGLHITGEQVQMYELSALPAVYHWEISADKAGKYHVEIIARLHITPDRKPIKVVSQHKIKVVKIPFLTSR